MNSSSYAAQLIAVEQSLRAAFTGGAAWPIDPAGLAALIDMGYSDRRIAGWFGVGPDDVEVLREEYRLAASAAIPA